MKVAIVGGRDFNDYEKLKEVVAKLEPLLESKITEIVSGGAKGADSLARRYAIENEILLKEFIPDWNIYKKTAGFIRNKDIVNYADIVIAFWDGQSKGTSHSISLGRDAKKEVIICQY